MILDTGASDVTMNEFLFYLSVFPFLSHFPEIPSSMPMNSRFQISLKCEQHYRSMYKDLRRTTQPDLFLHILLGLTVPFLFLDRDQILLVRGLVILSDKGTVSLRVVPRHSVWQNGGFRLALQEDSHFFSLEKHSFVCWKIRSQELWMEHTHAWMHGCTHPCIYLHESPCHLHWRQQRQLLSEDALCFLLFV